MKFDLRACTKQGSVTSLSARLYGEQTTNYVPENFCRRTWDYELRLRRRPKFGHYPAGPAQLPFGALQPRSGRLQRIVHQTRVHAISSRRKLCMRSLSRIVDFNMTSLSGHNRFDTWMCDRHVLIPSESATHSLGRFKDQVQHRDDRQASIEANLDQNLSQCLRIP